MAVSIRSWERPLLALAYGALESHKPAPERIYNGTHPLAEAYAASKSITRQHSRTFFMASAMLPKAERLAIRALYAFCRVSDDLVDQFTTNRDSKISQWRQHALSEAPPENDLVALAWADARSNYSIPRQYAEQLLDGVSRDLTKRRYQSFEELTDYCYAVASTVGLMTMHIVGYASTEAIPYAVKLGVALQLTNILRDVGEDWQNGRLYLPQEELAQFGLSEADIAAGCTDDRWRAFMRFQIARAHQLYQEAMPGIAMLGDRGQAAVAAAAELYRAILDDIEAHDYDVFSRRAHISGAQKLRQLPIIWWRTKTKRYNEPQFIAVDGSILEG